MLSWEVALGVAGSIVSALWAMIGLLLHALLRAKDAQIADIKEERDQWREIAVAGTSLAKDAIEAPPPPRRTR